jgi:hypothetical protein
VRRREERKEKKEWGKREEEGRKGRVLIMEGAVIVKDPSSNFRSLPLLPALSLSD